MEKTLEAKEAWETPRLVELVIERTAKGNWNYESSGSTQGVS